MTKMTITENTDNGMNSRILDAVMGVVVGDALGVPVEFCLRKDRDIKPVDGMWSYGTFNMPAGTWSDDSSMTIATVDALSRGYDLKRIAEYFVDWYKYTAYTPWGITFDVGNGTSSALSNYLKEGDVYSCGGSSERENGNGSLMRIIPVCIYCGVQVLKGLMTNDEAIKIIHEVSGITHNHIRSKIGCGLYYFMVLEMLKVDVDHTFALKEVLQEGLKKGFDYYGAQTYAVDELSHYDRTRNLDVFINTSRDDIKSSGYVVSTFEAAIWCLITTSSYEEAVLKAVNLGDDTDTVAAVTGGLAGLYYGIENIPKVWIETIVKRDYIEELCGKFEEAMK